MLCVCVCFNRGVSYVSNRYCEAGEEDVMEEEEEVMEEVMEEEAPTPPPRWKKKKKKTQLGLIDANVIIPSPSPIFRAI